MDAYSVLVTQYSEAVNLSIFQENFWAASGFNILHGYFGRMPGG
jgi:hypothetical protein